jgi:hypothetical protein
MLSLELEHFLAPSARARRLGDEVHGISRIFRAAAGGFSPRKLHGTGITYIGTRRRWKKLRDLILGKMSHVDFKNFTLSGNRLELGKLFKF